MRPVESISSTSESRLTRSLQKSRSGPQETKKIRRSEREVVQHQLLLVRIEAFGEFDFSKNDRLAHVIDFLVSGLTPIPRSFLVEIIVKTAKHLVVRVDAFHRRLAQ